MYTYDAMDYMATLVCVIRLPQTILLTFHTILNIYSHINQTNKTSKKGGAIHLNKVTLFVMCFDPR